MKTIINLSALLLLSIQIIAQPFAPKIDPPKNPGNDPEIAFAIQILSGIEVPNKSKVGVVPYPGAKIFQTTIAQSGMVATVRLLSTDEVSTVFEFYKKNSAIGSSKTFMAPTCFSRVMK